MVFAWPFLSVSETKVYSERALNSAVAPVVASVVCCAVAPVVPVTFTRENASIQKIVEHGIADLHPPLADAPPARIALGDSSELAAFAA